jgi:hypothetical protein
VTTRIEPEATIDPAVARMDMSAMMTKPGFHRAIFALLVLAGIGEPAARAAQPGFPSTSDRFRPDPATVERYGAGYRYPQAGWVVLHIEGEPYERGTQHGRLMAPEIGKLAHELARYRSSKAPADAWRDLRLIADALFSRRFDPEYLEEMKGIADGAAAAGAKIDGRPIDLLDIVTINADVETTFLDEALDATPTSVSGRTFGGSNATGGRPPAESHCSAFAVTGPATADGQVVFGHITMWNLFHAYHYNVWLDVKPTRGHRVLMQTYPGGIMSGLDYYMNDQGMVVCETTIEQTRFEAGGVPVADRIRRALQYSDSIDASVKILSEGNNGLYSNEWLLADTRKNEIAMFELGTHKSKLWRSSRKEWFGGTPGFYWGCNNAKDIQVRLEAEPAYEARPHNVVFHPSDRDREWLRLFDAYNKKIGVDFGFTAFTTPPLAAYRSLDAKFTTTAMAKELTTWAKWGPPLGRAWEPLESERQRFPGMHALIGNDWTVLRPEAPDAADSKAAKAVDLAKVAPGEGVSPAATVGGASVAHGPAWHGTLLPKTDADTWLAAGFADYEPIYSHEKAITSNLHAGKLSQTQQQQIDLAMFAPISHYLTAVARRDGKDMALSETRLDLRSDEWYDIAAGKGVLLMAALRTEMGDRKFSAFMEEYGREHAGQAVSSLDFLSAAQKKATGASVEAIKAGWQSAECPAELGQAIKVRRESGRFWAVDSFEREPHKSLIVYGTLSEADAHREAATALARKLAARWVNILVPIKADTEISDADLEDVHIVLVGRPTTNRVTARLAGSLPIRFGAASVTVGSETFAHPFSSVVAAGPSPFHKARSVVVFAGLSAEGMWDCPRRLPETRGASTAEVLLLPVGEPMRRLAITSKAKGAAVADRETAASR